MKVKGVHKEGRGSSGNMDSSVFDVTVLGAGVEGSATAYYLTNKAGVKKVLLLEQFSALHTRGSSHGCTRITRRAYYQPYYVLMMNEAYPMWSDLEQENGTKLYEKTGILVFDKKDGDAVERVINSLEVNKIPHQKLSAEEVNKKYPTQLCFPSDAQCVFEEDGGILMAKKAVAAYQKQFVASGGVFLDEHPVTEIIPGQVITLRTTKGTFRTKKLVITAGAWSSQVLKPLGLELPLEVLRTELVYWPTKRPEDFSKDVFPVFFGIGDDGDHFYGTPIHEYPGLIKICYHHGDKTSPDSRDAAQTTRGLQKVKGLISGYFKGVELSPSVVEPCMYTMTPDENPFLDRHPKHENIVIGAGFSGHGFKLSPVVGKILSELSLDLKPSYDLSPFRINRFETQEKL